jgi:hypothetical protein
VEVIVAENKKTTSNFNLGMDALMRARGIREKIQDQSSLPLGGKASKMGEGLYSRNRKAAEDAYDALQNLREDEAEMLEDRAKKNMDVEKKASGGIVSSASKRADGIAKRGKTRGKMV